MCLELQLSSCDIVLGISLAVETCESYDSKLELSYGEHSRRGRRVASLKAPVRCALLVGEGGSDAKMCLLRRSKLITIEFLV